jgi:hypothetical protein
MGELLMDSLAGSTGTITVATRGSDGPGEVMIKTGGGSEPYIAWSETPLARGATVLILDDMGARTLRVTGWIA